MERQKNMRGQFHQNPSRHRALKAFMSDPEKWARILRAEYWHRPYTDETIRILTEYAKRNVKIPGPHLIGNNREQKQKCQAAIFSFVAPCSELLHSPTTFETIQTMLVGYARVSTQEQTLHLQLDALKQSGCGKIFTDTISGATAERKGLDEALDYVRAGDTLVVWRLDRLGRSLKHLIDTISQLDNRSIGFRSLTENIDTTTSGGKLIFHIFGALAEFERNLIKERTNAGLRAARAGGRNGGRPKQISAKKIALAQELYDSKDTKQRSIAEICRSLNISRATLYRHITPEKKASSG